VGGWLRSIGVRFFPVVNWAERGVYGDGNSVPRFHLTWGSGLGLVDGVWRALREHPRRSALDLRLRTRVTALVETGGRVSGVRFGPEAAEGIHVPTVGDPGRRRNRQSAGRVTGP
jgi:predicted oxidoreductase